MLASTQHHDQHLHPVEERGHAPSEARRRVPRGRSAVTVVTGRPRPLSLDGRSSVQPARDALRQRREDDLVEAVQVDRVLDRVERLGRADHAGRPRRPAASSSSGSASSSVLCASVSAWSSGSAKRSRPLDVFGTSSVNAPGRARRAPARRRSAPGSPRCGWRPRGRGRAGRRTPCGTPCDADGRCGPSVRRARRRPSAAGGVRGDAADDAAAPVAARRRARCGRGRRARMRALAWRAGGAALAWRALAGLGGDAAGAVAARRRRGRAERCDDAELGHEGGAGAVAAQFGLPAITPKPISRYGGLEDVGAVAGRVHPGGHDRPRAWRGRRCPRRGSRRSARRRRPTGSRRRGCARRAGSRRGPRGRSSWWSTMSLPWRERGALQLAVGLQRGQAAVGALGVEQAEAWRRRSWRGWCASGCRSALAQAVARRRRPR